MKFEQFQESLSASAPPENFSEYLQALWYDGKGNWNKAHSVIQNIEDRTAAWIHAYLHRKEGDIGNADYWYRRAGRSRPTTSLQQESKDIVNTLL